MTRLRVVQRRELLDPSPADLIHDPLAEAPVQVADELGVRLGQLAERAVQELDAGGALGGAVARLDRGLEPEPEQLGFQRPQAAAGPCALSGLDPPRVAGVGGVVGIGADALGERGQQAGEQRVGRRVEPESGRAGGEEVAVLRTTDRAAMDGLDVDQSDLTQPVEVQPDGVRVQPEAVGELLRRRAARSPRPAPGTSRNASRHPVP